MTKTIKPRAFSLLEVTLAAALAGVVIAASLSASTTIQRSLTSSRRSSLLSERRELLEEQFGPLLRQIGQNTIRPWEAILTNSSGGVTQQHVHIIETSSDPHIAMDAAWNGTATTVPIALVSGECPLTAINGWTGPRDVVIVPESTSTTTPTFTPGWVTARCTPSPSPSPTTCQCTFAAVPGASDNTETIGTVTSWGKARIAIGQTVSIQRNTANNELIVRRDEDGDGTRDSVRFINDIYGIDLTFGILQADGSILFQSSIPVANFSDLRLVKLELALGARDINAPTGSVALGNGTVTRSQTRLTKATTVAVLATAASL